jgi:hypothetical protein
VKEHHRQQTAYLGVFWQQFRQGAAQPDRLGRQLVAPAVSLLEDEVDHGEDGVETLSEQVHWRHSKRDPRRFDLALGPHQALRHRALWDEERSGDLVCGEPAEGPQREGNLRLDR